MQCLALYFASAKPEGRFGSQQLPRRQRWRPKLPSLHMQTCRPRHRPGAALGLSWLGLFPPASVCRLWLWHYHYAVPAPAGSTGPKVVDAVHLISNASLTNGKGGGMSMMQCLVQSASTLKHDRTRSRGHKKEHDSTAQVQVLFHSMMHRAGVVESFGPA